MNNQNLAAQMPPGFQMNLQNLNGQGPTNMAKGGV